MYFCIQNAAKQTEFFKTKGFAIAQEFLVHEKRLVHTDYELPSGYEFRSLKKEDLLLLEEVSRNDPKMKSLFIASNYESFMDSSFYDPESVVVVEKDGNVVGFYGLYIPSEPDSFHYLQSNNSQKVFIRFSASLCSHFQ